MTTERIFDFLTLLPFLVILYAVVGAAIRHPWRANIDIALFFAALAGVSGVGWIADLVVAERPDWLLRVTRALAVLLPYLLLRVVADFAAVPRWLLGIAGAGLAAALAAVMVWTVLPDAVTLTVVAYFVALQIYCAVKFVRTAAREHGVTARRMQAAATGSVLLGLAILIAGIGQAGAQPAPWVDPVVPLVVLASGLAYLAGFAPPTALRRAWQQPELSAFLKRISELAWLGDTGSVVRRIQEGAAASFGAQHASVLLWDEENDTLWTPGDTPGERVPQARPGQYIAGRAFKERRAIFTPDATVDDPANAEVYRRWEARAVMSAPIIGGDEPLGVLTVFGPRAPIFASDDLELMQLLADQAAVALKARRLLEEAAGIRAREEATRLRDDFLSAAAHDIKTPLTSILGYAQILEMKAEADPGQPADIALLKRISREAGRLRDLVARLLDVGRGEAGGLVAEDREATDLVELARELCERHTSAHHPCTVDADGPVVASVDPVRIVQLLDNLLENGKKYTPDGGRITVSLEIARGEGGDEARITVRDPGIGIPPEDLPHIFDRFRRAANIDDRRFAGMGLGLYICRMIAEQHGGRIRVDSRVGEGSVFHVALPVEPPRTEGVEEES